MRHENLAKLKATFPMNNGRNVIEIFAGHDGNFGLGANFEQEAESLCCVSMPDCVHGRRYEQFLAQSILSNGSRSPRSISNNGRNHNCIFQHFCNYSSYPHVTGCVSYEDENLVLYRRHYIRSDMSHFWRTHSWTSWDRFFLFVYHNPSFHGLWSFCNLGIWRSYNFTSFP